VLDVVVVRPRLVARKPRRQRLGRLRPVNDGEHDQREADEDGEPDEKTATLHDRAAYGLCPAVAATSECNAARLRHRLRCRLGGRGGFAAATVSTRAPPPVQYETATLEPPFRSPSRFRFRPPAPLTFGFRLLPSLPASTYLRSVLGANGNLGEVRSFRKRSEDEKGAICRNSIFHISTAHLAACGNRSPPPASLAMPAWRSGRLGRPDRPEPLSRLHDRSD